MDSIFQTERLAAFSARRPKTILAAWGSVLAVAFFLLATLFGEAMTSEFFQSDDPESVRAEELVADRLRDGESVGETVIVRSDTLTVDDPALRDAVTGIQAELEALGASAVSSAVTYYDEGDEALVSPDRTATIIPIVIPGDIRAAEDHIEAMHHIVDVASEESPAIEALITGEVTFSVDFAELGESDAIRGEAIGAPVALIILAVVFGTLMAAFLPLGIAILSIVFSLAVVSLLGQVYDMHTFTLNIITMIGLAVGVDYALFIVSRYREERAHGRDTDDAIRTAGATANRAVLFSGLTVVIALAGLIIIPHSAFFSLGIGAITVVIFSILTALTLLPALLSLLGDRIERLRVPLIGRAPKAGADPTGGVWDRVSYAVMRRPVVALVASVAVLLALAAPALNLETRTAGVSTFPDDLRVSQGFAALGEEFGSSLSSPAEVVIDVPASTPGLEEGITALTTALNADADFGSISREISADGSLTLLTVSPVGDPEGETVSNAVERLREEYVPAAFGPLAEDVYVGGVTARDLDFIELTQTWTPIVFAVVLGLSFVLLMLVFRSVVVPAKAIVMNLLSVGAAYGVLVAVFQAGWGAGLLGIDEAPGLQPWLPLFLFTILFGLSMDYHVFLLSRVRERFVQTGNNSESVAYGLRTTAGLITGAALIMVAVFGGFATGESVQLQQMGLGMATAIFLDATIVRVVLVPASMKLLGSANWYMPSFLSWLPQIHVEGPALQPAAVPVTDAD